MNTMEQSIVVIARQNSILDWLDNFGYKKGRNTIQFCCHRSLQKIAKLKEQD